MLHGEDDTHNGRIIWKTYQYVGARRALQGLLNQTLQIGDFEDLKLFRGLDFRYCNLAIGG